MLYLSASSIKDFLHCSKMFFYRQTCPEESVSNDAMNMGTVIHGAVEHHWTSETLAMEYASSKINSFGMDRLVRDKAEMCIYSFFNAIPELYNVLSDNDLIEYKFKEKLTDDITLVGKIDRIVVDEGVLIDWKTGSTKKNISNDVQYIIYYQMYKRIFNKLPSRVVQVNLAKGEIIDFHPNQVFIDTLFNKVIPYIASRVQAKEFIKEGYFTNSCYNCAYDTVCYKDR